nr:immunoglobulin heavy chain junction region [Mus musculus]
TVLAITTVLVTTLTT